MNYNARNYNDQRYNIDGVFYATALTETVTETDGTQIADLLKFLADSFSETDTLVMSTDVTLSDFMFLDEMIQIQFANKALGDTIRLADWLSIERAPAQNGWFD